jgi:hypothetical protein
MTLCRGIQSTAGQHALTTLRELVVCPAFGGISLVWATLKGSHYKFTFLIKSFKEQTAFYHFFDLFIGEMTSHNCTSGTQSRTGAAPFAQSLIDPGYI